MVGVGLSEGAFNKEGKVRSIGTVIVAVSLGSGLRTGAPCWGRFFCGSKSEQEKAKLVVAKHGGRLREVPS
jgi:hypothetical protein